MILEIDHVLIAVADPDGVAADLAATLGLLPAGGGIHEAIGTRNALLSLGGPYLELIGLVDETPATRERALRHPIGAAVIRALDVLAAEARRGAGPPATAGGPATCAYVTVALRSDDVTGDLARLATAETTGPARAGPGIVASEVVRRRPDGSVVRWPVAFPRRLGPEDPPFVIEHAPDEPERAARVAGGGVDLLAVSVAVADPTMTGRRWEDAWGIAPAVGGGEPALAAGGGPGRSAPVRLQVGPHAVDLLDVAVAPATAIVLATGPIGRGIGAPAHVADRGGVRFIVG